MTASAAWDLEPATARDAAELAVLTRDLIETGLQWRWRPPQIADLIARSDTRVLVVRLPPLNTVGERLAQVIRPPRPIAAFGALSLARPACHLMLLAVSSAHQRLGLGSVLLQRFEQLTRNAGASQIHLEVRAANRGARDFYRNHGFYEHVYVDGYYDGVEAALQMRRRIDDDPLTLSARRS